MATPFEIHVSEQRLDRLKQKLSLTDYPSGILSADANSWEKGVPVAEIKRLAEYWKTSFDWRKVERELNTMPQFLTPIEIDGFGSYNIHHIHKRSKRTDAIPLLFLHGWPGCFHEVSKMLDGLVTGTEGEPVFHVIAPSLIDFGFSDPNNLKTRFGFEQHAEAYHRLMKTLGYNTYVIQAGDVGGLVSRYIAKTYGPGHCKAHHTNTPTPSQPTEKDHPELHDKTQTTPLTEAEQKGLGRTAHFQADGSGYFKQQTTRPLTIGYCLCDSPVGLLSWIYEKMRDWSDSYPWTDDEILTWVSIYYFSTAGPEASINLYYEMEHSDPPAFAVAGSFVDVPLGISRFANDLVVLPKLWNQTMGPVVYENDEPHTKGGHFAAWENPEAIVGDLRKMFGSGRKVRFS
ncbi:alpha/beta-hydrolase [Massarina eburnea CBS 473.64]|uniref:Alpha/beta-hydrolase n=1 Tax=Massarina eburnea CBS 473.64 TaxID=1395130 RepID=A0A6A6S3Z5_9PLEO|nr:alpha/beta-hydrolase [Massarina eburnea CBS 473.64]